MVVQLVLSSPNDGVTEVAKAKLPYANQVSIFEGECHVTGMQYPFQLYNEERNKEVNAAAAR